MEPSFTGPSGFCPQCYTKPCVCLPPVAQRIGHYHFTPNQLTAEDVRRIMREELERSRLQTEGKP